MNWERSEPGPPDPLNWSLPLVRIAGIAFRLHFVFLAYAALQLLAAWLGPVGTTPLHGPSSMGMALVALLVVVTVREAARALVVRAAGGSADEVALWPLGSLQGIDPGAGSVGALLAGAVGPAASLVLAAVLGAVLAATTGDWSAAVPDPLSAAWLANPHPAWMEFLWILQWTGFQVALLGLLPMQPLDGGRAVEAIAIARRGAFDAPRAAATGSLAAAALCGVVAVVRGLPTLLSVAIACAGFAALQLWRLRAGDAVGAARGPWERMAQRGSAPDGGLAEDPEAAAREERARARERAATEERAVDAVLEKIAREGAERLTAAEREVLARATRRRQGGS